MKPVVTRGIVLARVNYQEADRILTVLSEDQGKLRLMAKGVRKERSKLAGGVELFSVSELSFIRGRGDIGTLVSSRLNTHFGTIVKNIERTMYGYDFLKLMNKITEDNVDSDYFILLENVLAALNNESLDLSLVKLWADMRLLAVTGHIPNLTTDTAGNRLDVSKNYDFEISEMTFSARPDGLFQSGHIKLFRLVGHTSTNKLTLVDGLQPYIAACQHLAQTMRKSVLHV